MRSCDRVLMPRRSLTLPGDDVSLGVNTTEQSSSWGMQCLGLLVRLASGRRDSFSSMVPLVSILKMFLCCQPKGNLGTQNKIS